MVKEKLSQKKKKKSNGKGKTLTPREKVSQQRKKSHGKRKSLTARENVSRWKKKSHGVRNVSQRSKMPHNKTRKIKILPREKVKNKSD